MLPVPVRGPVKVQQGMVFFNYSTMQMAAKVVYYGPGLCGKTTNLHYIYGHTSGDSRGEMVSLETETDRTLFFDLLPIDVGQIAGFNTRIQLYTVPGQVFYNTTRKLVLKGVDGVVFVADSQRAMQQANVDSFKNLEENLAEMGLSSESLPLVLQFNKRDLADICSVEEINRNLNPRGWPHFEASALTGQGVFETLKGVSKLTLLSLKKRLTRGGESSPSTRMAPPRPVPPLPSSPTAANLAAGAAAGAARPAPAPPAASPASPAAPAAAAPTAPARPAPAPLAPPRPAAPAPPATAAAPARTPPLRGRSSVDVLGELEKLRREAMQPAPAPSTPRPATAPVPLASPPAATPPAAVSSPATAPPVVARPPVVPGKNGRGELSRNIELTLKRADFERARRILVSFQVEDDQNRVMDSVRDLPVEIKDAASLEKLLLRLNIALNAKE
jgi:signal recognition particle receptor subunit beta